MKRNSPDKDLSNWFANKDFYCAETLGNTKELFSRGQKKAIKLFEECAKRVPAYAKFLKGSGINAGLIKSFADFEKIPVTTKENYIEKYAPDELCWDGKLSNATMISTSSGTTGRPHFWPREVRHEIEGALPHELIFNQLFEVGKRKTLLVNGFAMGNWIAGTFTYACANLTAWKSQRLTIMTPGYNLESVVDILQNISPFFDQTIVTGHNPFLKEIVDEAASKGWGWEKINPKFLGTGQAVTESWRKYILDLTGTKDYYHTFYNLYGSADASLMGWETPLSIHARRFVTEQSLQSELFGDQRIPSIVAYDPRLTYFEAINKELHVTKDSGCPLVRYNIHDEGGMLDISQLYGLKISPLARKEVGSGSDWSLPLVYLFGRSKFMTKIYGANIYTEHVQLALDHQTIAPFLTGRFILECEYDKSQNPQLVCRVELNSKTRPEKDLQKLVGEVFVEQVRMVNAEYRDVMKNMGDRVRPAIVLYNHGDEKYFPLGKVKKTA